jgi:hypothetical protein
VEPSGGDADASNNRATLTVVASDAPSSGGESTGSAVATSAVKLSPAKPKAGSTVVASVRVTKGGSPVRPTRIACAASVGKAKTKGTPKSASGVASCLFRTPRSARGKSLTGSLSFRAGGASFTKRFATRLS